MRHSCCWGAQAAALQPLSKIQINLINSVHCGQAKQQVQGPSPAGPGAAITQVLLPARLDPSPREWHGWCCFNQCPQLGIVPSAATNYLRTRAPPPHAQGQLLWWLLVG